MAFDLTTLVPVPATTSGDIIASQTLTVSTTSVSAPVFATPDTRWVLFEVITSNVRVRWDGTAPTSTLGHLLFVNYGYLWPVNMFSGAKFIRDSGASVDATIFASPLKPP